MTLPKALIHINISDQDLETLIKDVETHLDQIAWLLKVKNENHFRIRAWLKAKSKIYGIAERFVELVNQRILSSINEIGESIEAEIYHFLENNGESHYLNGLQLEVPQFLLKYRFDLHIRNALAKASHSVHFQSENELLFFCLMDYFKSFQMLYSPEERKLKDYFYKDLGKRQTQLIPSKVRGFYLHSPRVLDKYGEQEVCFLNQLDWIFHNQDYSTKEEQCCIQNPKRIPQFSNIQSFETYYSEHHLPIIDLSQLSLFFQEGFFLSTQFLDLIAQRKSAYLFCLENSFYSQNQEWIQKIRQHNAKSGFIFSLLSSSFLKESPLILATLIDQCQLSEKQILNFSSQNQILRFLQRFS
ncbi:hypothetical protein MJH12_16330 [bacterium]|nr:hypothetical protein [bacterium]